MSGRPRTLGETVACLLGCAVVLIVALIIVILLFKALVWAAML